MKYLIFLEKHYLFYCVDNNGHNPQSAAFFTMLLEFHGVEGIIKTRIKNCII